MIYATEYELIAELVYQHKCRNPACFCWELRRRPAIDAVIRALHIEKLRSKATEPAGDLSRAASRVQGNR